MATLDQHNIINMNSVLISVTKIKIVILTAITTSTRKNSYCFLVFACLLFHNIIMPHQKKKWHYRHTIKLILHMNAFNNHQLLRSGHYATFSVMFSPLHCVTSEEQYKKRLCNQSSHYKSTDYRK